MRVMVDVEHITLEGDYTDIDSVRVTCVHCGHSVEVYGTDERSMKRGCIMLRDECPMGEENFYMLRSRDR